ncbi:MAG TPA: ankyrin repeat domain-containing protein, partial [Leptospiraceae bacterium]|nr:ankyrin repeat domain-containing protein [Leptospiraceae bacterium]
IKNFQKKYNGSIYLPLACTNGNTDIIQMLIDRKSDLNQKNDSGEAPVFLALKSGNEKAVLNINAGRTESALSVCKTKEIALIFLKNGAELKAGNDRIFPYHRFPDGEMIEIAIKNNYDFETLDSEKDTVLIKAVRSSETGAVQE